MRVKWLGHASFLITSDKGTRILTDPYVTGGELNYGEIRESADIVTVSHEHFDHANVATVGGNPEVVTKPIYIKGIPFQAVSTYHDEVKGSKRGKNTIFYFEVDGIKICHLGDLGHQLNNVQADKIGALDILLVPVGGYYTIGAREATGICNLLKPKVIIPMHFKNKRCTFPIAKVDEFLQGKKGISKMDSSEVKFKKGDFSADTRIIVLQPAL